MFLIIGIVLYDKPIIGFWRILTNIGLKTKKIYMITFKMFSAFRFILETVLHLSQCQPNLYDFSCGKDLKLNEMFNFLFQF